MSFKNRLTVFLQNIIPRDENLYEYFKAQVAILQKSIPILNEIASGATPWDPKWAIVIKRLEEECDHATKQIHEQTEKVFILPLDLEDIKALAHSIDEVMDFIEEAVILISDWKFARDKDIVKLLECASNSIGIVAYAVENLKGFSGFPNYRERMRELENEADKVYRNVVRVTYDLDVCEIIHRNEGEVLMVSDLVKIEHYRTIRYQKQNVAERLENAIDMCNEVFHVLGGIHAKQT